MDITEQVLNGQELVTIKEFCNEHHNGLSPQAIDYAIAQDWVDYVRIGRFRYIVLNDKSKNYQPNKSTRRSTISL